MKLIAELPVLLKEVAVLSLMAVVTALTVNFFSPAGISLIQTDSASNSPDVTIVDLETVQKIATLENVVVVDARSQEQYQAGHIPGAVCLPAYNSDDAVFSFMDNYPLTTTVITYCSGVLCHDSHVLADELGDVGYTDVMIFAGGLEAWQERGLDIVQDF